MGAGVITYVGLEYIAKLLNGLSTNFFDYVAVGTGTTPETYSDTALEVEKSGDGLSRALATLEYVYYGISKFSKVWTYTGTGITITEWGIFDAASVGNMLARQVISGEILATNDTLTLTVWVHFEKY